MREVQTSSARRGDSADRLWLRARRGRSHGNGACDYLVKPCASRNWSWRGAGVAPAERSSKEFGKDTETLIGTSPAWERALERARQAAATDADVLIEPKAARAKS